MIPLQETPEIVVEKSGTSIYQWQAYRWLSPMLYLVALTVAEVITAMVNPQLGMVMHAVLLLVLPVHAAAVPDSREQKLLICICLAPLIRIMSLALPISTLPLVYWFVIVSAPLFPAIYMAIKAAGLTMRDVGLTANHLPVQVLVTLTGIPLGVAEYLILAPEPLVKDFSISSIWFPALVLLIGTGFLEEIIFRGVLQKVSADIMGSFKALIYVSALFAALHIGYLSIVDVVFVFGAGAWFAFIAIRTGSILGPTCAHGLTNITLYLIAPFVFSNGLSLAAIASIF